MNEPLVAIIVLCWNGKKDTLECLESLRKLRYPNYRTILVDNGSTDGTSAAVRDSFPEAEVIETRRNVGFAAGNNVGINHALERGADAVFLLNNDTTVDPDLLTSLVTSLYRSPDIGAVNPTIYYYDQPSVIWSAGGTLDWQTGIAYQRHVDEVDIGQLRAEEEVDYGVGAALLMRREAAEAVGLLDPSFFLYYEETDWCSRARDAGYKTIFVPSGKVWHKVSQSMNGRSATQLYYCCRNRLLFMSKRGTGSMRLLRIAVGDFGRMSAAMALRGERREGLAVARAVLDFYLDRLGEAKL